MVKAYLDAFSAQIDALDDRTAELVAIVSVGCWPFSNRVGAARVALEDGGG